MLKYNYDKLKGKIKEVFGTQNKFAEAMKIAPNTLSSKLSGQTDFSCTEIDKAAELLHIESAEESWYIFFTKCVENISTK